MASYINQASAVVAVAVAVVVVVMEELGVTGDFATRKGQ